MDILEVRNLCKRYPAFELKNVSFSLEEGKITGFIGRNGAGKTTTLKSIFNFVHPDGGEIRFFGKSFSENELDIKQKVGFLSGGVDYYPKKMLKTITSITKSFYREWDEKAYEEYMKMWDLDEEKTPSQLSAGMRVKYALALALSHRAKLLILDEPTSGLDPVSRDELLDVLMELCGRGVTVLFSTHITSDLDKCADNILYIKGGRILAESDIRSFVSGYQVLEFHDALPAGALGQKLIGCRRSKNGYTALIRAEDARRMNAGAAGGDADLETIMIHIEKEGEK
jgi:ABC-2 type transport system ATP-binding protein